MKSIYAYAIEHTDALEIKERVVAIAETVNKELYERFVEVILGINKTLADFPQSVYVYNNRIQNIISYDPLRDEIRYSYKETKTRYFLTEEDANKYSETGEYRYSTSEINPDEKYAFEGVHTFINDGITNSWDWLNSEIIYNE